MKTTVEISDNTLALVRAVQQSDAVTLKELIDEGLNLAVERRRSRRGFRLDLPTVDGNGLLPQAERLGMSALLRMAADGSIDCIADSSDAQQP